MSPEVRHLSGCQCFDCRAAAVRQEPAGPLPRPDMPPVDPDPLTRVTNLMLDIKAMVSKPMPPDPEP